MGTLEEPLSLEELRIYERRLWRALSSLSGVVEDIEHQALEPSGDPRFQTEDEAVEEALLEGDLDALAVEDELAQEVHDALERIADGSFGLCEECGDWIARARLAVLPHARRCARCAQRT